MKVRRALEKDVEALIDLNAIVQALHVELYPNDFNPSVDPLVMKEYFQKTLREPLSTIAIAEVDDTAAGYVWFEIQTRLETPFTKTFRRVYIHHLAVSPRMRRRGIATALIGYVEECAESHGIEEIALETWALNKDALNFFATQEFKLFRIIQRKNI